MASSLFSRSNFLTCGTQKYSKNSNQLTNKYSNNGAFRFLYNDDHKQHISYGRTLKKHCSSAFLHQHYHIHNAHCDRLILEHHHSRNHPRVTKDIKHAKHKQETNQKNTTNKEAMMLESDLTWSSNSTSSSSSNREKSIARWPVTSSKSIIP